MTEGTPASAGEVDFARPEQPRYAGPGAGPVTLDVSPRQPDGTIYIGVTGDWDRAAAAHIRSVFRQVGEHQPSLVITDLGGVRRIDPGGLSALVAAYRYVVRSGGQLRLQNVPPHIRRLLRRTQLTHALTFDEEEPHVQRVPAPAQGAADSLKAPAYGSRDAAAPRDGSTPRPRRGR